VSQQLTSGPDLDGVHPEVLLEAAAPVLKSLAVERGFTRLAVFGSVGLGDARPDFINVSDRPGAPGFICTGGAGPG
jgi:hypothetical protein